MAMPAFAAECARYEFGDVVVDASSRVVTRAGRELVFTRLEFNLLLHFLEHPRTALTRRRILREVWHHQAEVLTRTVDIHVRRLRQKLECEAGPQHFVTVWKIGYRFDP